jgi:hypothetical protein
MAAALARSEPMTSGKPRGAPEELAAPWQCDHMVEIEAGGFPQSKLIERSGIGNNEIENALFLLQISRAVGDLEGAAPGPDVDEPLPNEDRASLLARLEDVDVVRETTPDDVENLREAS